MTQDEIIEMAIQGHASTRDAIRWAMNLKPHQCPRCFGLFKVGERFWNDSGTVYHLICWVNKSKEKNP